MIGIPKMQAPWRLKPWLEAASARLWRTALAAAATLAFALGGAGPALAWGDEGHEAIALVAYGQLTPATRAIIDQMIADQPPAEDEEAAPSFKTWADWADEIRFVDEPETFDWHYAAFDVAKSPSQTCPGAFSRANDTLEQYRPAKVCIIDKLYEFAAVLRDPTTTPEDRVRAIKFLVHLVGDAHQPLHVASRDDASGACVRVDFAGAFPGERLHGYWDIDTVAALGDTPEAIAAKLTDPAPPADEAKAWSKELEDWLRGRNGAWAAAWVRETFMLALPYAYDFPNRDYCSSDATVTLSDSYRARAEAVTATQLRKAGYRLAFLLNGLLDPGFLPDPPPSPQPEPPAAPEPTQPPGA